MTCCRDKRWLNDPFFYFSGIQKAWVWLVAAIGLLASVITDRWEMNGEAVEREQS